MVQINFVKLVGVQLFEVAFEKWFQNVGNIVLGIYLHIFGHLYQWKGVSCSESPDNHEPQREAFPTLFDPVFGRLLSRGYVTNFRLAIAIGDVKVSLIQCYHVLTPTASQ